MALALIIICLLLVALLIWIIIIYNKFNIYLTKIEESNSSIDVALQKRYDVLTKMIDTVKSYKKYEKETLFEIVKLRKDMTLNEKLQENEKISKNLEKIQLIVENYPELKASENYKVLQQSIVDVEEHLQAARRAYNSNVSIYNQMLSTFPSNIIGNVKSLKKLDFFKVEENKNEDIKVSVRT